MPDGPAPTMIAVLRAVRESTLTPPQRLLVVTATGLSDPKTGVIPERFRPRLADIAAYTGLSRTSVWRVLLAAEALGWVVRDSKTIAAVRIPVFQPETTESGGVFQAETSEGENVFQAETSEGENVFQAETSEDPGCFTEKQDCFNLKHEMFHSENDTVLPDPYVPSNQNTQASDGTLFTVEPHPESTNRPTRKTDDPLPDVDAFWKVYPRRVAKGHARKAWATAIRNGTDPAVIVAAAELFAAQCARNRTETRFIPHPSTWLNGERWADQAEPHTGPRPSTADTRAADAMEIGARLQAEADRRANTVDGDVIEPKALGA